MYGLGTFESYLLASLLLSAIAKLILVFCELGNLKIQKIEVYISFAFFTGFWFLNSGLFTIPSDQVLRVFIGLLFFVIFLAFILLKTWKMATKNQEANLGYLISPVINIIVILGGIYILLINCL